MLRAALFLAVAALTLSGCDTAEAPSPDIPSDTASAVSAATESAPAAPEPAPTSSVAATPSAKLAPVLPKTPPITPPKKATPPSGEDACGASKLGRWRGSQPTNSVMAEIRRASGAQRIRTIRPGDVVTMDYSESRLNVNIGEDGRIESFRCG
ncbi:MAG: I78 family peptidase inhibitor [Novosphingobium sp.]